MGRIAAAALSCLGIVFSMAASAQGAVGFASAGYTVNESASSAIAVVTRTGPTTSALSVSWTTANASAVAGADFGMLGDPTQRSGMLSWAAGDALPKNIVIPIVHDTDFESDETFTITLSAPTGGAVLGAIATTTITITDDESSFQFSTPTVSVSETGPNVSLTVTRTGALSKTATVRYATANGTAMAPADYTAVTAGVLSFAAGDTAKTISIGPVAGANIPVVNDAMIESLKTFTVTLSSPTAGGQIGTASVATVTIESEERGIAMVVAAQTVAESAGSMDVMVARAGPTNGDVTVSYTLVNGTAINGTHFTGANGTLTWSSGDGAPKAIPVSIADDGAVNANRTFTVRLSAPSVGALGTPNQTVVTIGDDDNTVQFTAPTANFTEGMPTLTLSVSRAGGVAAPASVSWSTVDGTALAGTDFGALGNTTPVGGTINWVAGDRGAKSVSIPMLNDVIVEGAKTFDVSLSSPIGANVGTNATVKVTLNDNDAGVAFATAAYTVRENGGSVVVTVNRIGPVTAAANVKYATVNGDAIAGQDYAQRAGTLAWAAGDATARTIVIPITNDAANDGADETFTVVLSAPSAGIVLGSPNVATVTILDDDIPVESELTFSPAKVLVMENAGNAVVSVSRAAVAGGNIARAASVTWTTQAGTALTGRDFTMRTGTLSWPPGDGDPKTLAVPILNDTVAESPETFKVLLSNATPGARIATPSATVLIVDDDEVFPPQGAIPSTWTIPAGATAGFRVANDATAFEGVYSLRSEEIDDDQTAQIQVSGTFAAGMVSFRFRVSSEPGFDFLRFYVDDVRLNEWSGTANTTWQLFSTSLTAGTHTLRWAYEKDGSVSAGQDAVLIDAVSHPAMSTP
jgi:hypothetical protein